MALGEDQPCSSSQSNEAAAPRELLMVAAAEVEVGAYVRERCSRQKELSSVGSRTRDHGESLHSLGARRARRDMKRPPAIWLVAFRAQNFKGCKPVASAPDQPPLTAGTPRDQFLFYDLLLQPMRPSRAMTAGTTTPFPFAGKPIKVPARPSAGYLGFIELNQRLNR